MNGILKVTPQELRTVSGEFDGYNNEVAGLSQQMLSLIAGLTGSIWSGEAATGYQSKFAALATDMEKIRRKISEHVDDLMEMAGAYEQSEQSAVQEASALKTDII